MSSGTAVSIDEICARGSVKDADVQRLRKLIFTDGAVSEAEARALLRINDACKVQDASWPDFLIEAVTDYLVNDAEPQGYLTAANAAWLIEIISRDGKVQSKTELELLVSLLDRARWSPESLARFALDQVRSAVVSGEGPLRSGLDLKAGEISEGEIELLRRILYAFGGDGNIAITRAEAEVLFEINDAVSNGPLNPAFTDLFVKAIANAVMAGSGYAVPSREEALRREVWLESRGDLSIGAVVEAMAKGGLGGLYASQTSEERALARLERQRIEIITNEEVTQGETGWLADRLGRDGKLTPAESALIAFLKRENPKLDATFEALVGKLAVAA